MKRKNISIFFGQNKTLFLNCRLITKILKNKINILVFIAESVAQIFLHKINHFFNKYLIVSREK